MRVSIIIPTKDRAKILQETVLNITQKQNYPSDGYEVIIINDGNEDLSSTFSQLTNVKVIKNPGNGAASARNTGARVASGEILIFIDDDILIGPECINRHLYIHNKYEHSIVSGCWKYNESIIQLLNTTPFGRYRLLFDYKSLEGKEECLISQGVYTTDSLASFNLSILKKDFEQLNGFNQKFPYAGCEDQEFTLRAKQLNFRLLLDTDNVSIHNEKDRISMDKWLKRQYTGVQGYVLLCELFPYRKAQPLYIENGIIRKGDSLGIQAKKIIKRILSAQPVLSIIVGTAKLFEKLKITDSVLFKLYTVLCGLYIYKGFSLSEKINLSSKA